MFTVPRPSVAEIIILIALMFTLFVEELRQVSWSCTSHVLRRGQGVTVLQSSMVDGGVYSYTEASI